MLISLIILNILDALTTFYVLRYGGKEQNKVMAWLFVRIGLITTLVTTKGIYIILLVVFASNLSFVFLMFSNLIYIYVVIANTLNCIYVFYGWGGESGCDH